MGNDSSLPAPVLCVRMFPSLPLKQQSVYALDHIFPPNFGEICRSSEIGDRAGHDEPRARLCSMPHTRVPARGQRLSARNPVATPPMRRSARSRTRLRRGGETCPGSCCAGIKARWPCHTPGHCRTPRRSAAYRPLRAVRQRRDGYGGRAAGVRRRTAGCRASPTPPRGS
jgi:hypothetical protein